MVRSNKEYRFAIVGSGPAGFYCGKQILKNTKNVRVDIFDRNPHPFGLVRTGVAPDHPEMKKIEKDYQEILRDTERCRFFGNVWVGTNNGIPIEKLRELYSGVVLAYGATSERKLGLPNEESLRGVFSSRQMANWYNGSLDDILDPEQDLDLQNLKDMAIIGNGNVAMDISRVLLKNPKLLQPFDAPTPVIEQLMKLKLKNLSVIGRRGVIQSAFTIKEIREISRIENVQLYMFREEYDQSRNDQSIEETGAGFSPLSRGWHRRTEFLKETCKFIDSIEQYQDITHSRNDTKNLFLRYLQNPIELLSNQISNRINKVRLQKMVLEGEVGHQRAVPDPQNIQSEIECQLLVKSIGYQSRPIEGVTFNSQTCTIPHQYGCILDKNGQIQPGFYVAGWLKRGPNGIIDATLRDSVETFRIIKHHMECDDLQEKNTTVEEVLKLIPSDQKSVDFIDWQKIDSVEKKRGEEHGKTREKILVKEDMLKIIK
ncbi:UNKNOWN [Stylonychia lemnae]|uniref:NADPH:adrenodoxin oxidoreductase, mitochondrial n=1 Tax=Stylonychia lemnae TaxID=5949 RepID=A0A078AIN3_STYLE|nr:UNKNOWN [Stylonychia lemnae]|eukprot:CDW82125.1 UNKNOWN [Stylonychia lemnae]